MTGDQFKAFRISSGLSQQKLADAAGMHRNQVYKIETGEIDLRNITAAGALALATALGATVEELLS